MRKNSNSLVVWLIIGAIAVVFIFFGVGPGGQSGRGITVNGEEINDEVYNTAYDHFRRQLMQAQGGESSDALERQAKEYAAISVVSEVLAAQFGKKVGLTPTDDAVRQQIAATFSKEGRFDKETYNRFLESNRLSAAAYERQVRSEILLNNRIGSLVSDLSNVYQPEALEMWHFQEDQVAFDFVFFPALTHRAELAPTDEQLSAFFANNQERWRRPASMSLTYVDIRPESFWDQVVFTEAELQDYYDENHQRFTLPETAEVSHILFKFPGVNPSEDEKKALRAKAEEAYTRAQTEDFAALAKEVSDDRASAENGGSLGSIGRGMVFGPLDEVIFKANLNEVSPPVETVLGFHLVKVTARQEGGTKPLEEVRAEIEAELRAFKGRQLAVNQLEDLIIRSETSQLADAAKSMNLVARVTEPFTTDNPPDFFEGDAGAVQKAFSATLGRAASPFEGDKHLVFFSPSERTETHIPQLDEVRSEVLEAWLDAESVNLARLDVAAFVEQVGGEGWEKALTGLEGVGTVKRGQSDLAARPALAGIDPFQGADPRELFASVFSVARPGDVSPVAVSGQFEGVQGAFALRLKDFQAAEAPDFDGGTGRIFGLNLKMEKSNLLYLVWRQGLYQASEDKISIPNRYTN